MTNQNSLENRKAEIIGWVVQGKNDPEIAALISTKRKPITRQAVCSFRHKYAAEIQAQMVVVERQVTDFAIAQKVARIADMDDRWRRFRRIIEARATDTRYNEPGYKTGMLAHSIKSIGSGPFAQVVDEYEVDTATSAEMRSLELQAARELGQLPEIEKRYGDTNILAGQVVIVRETPGLGVG